MTRSVPLGRRLAVSAAFVAPALARGPLNPPPGPVSSTMRTLAEIEPRIPIHTLPGSPDTLHAITAPGHYVLTANLSGAQGKHAIQVAADNVAIDLNGFTISGVPGSLDGILVGTLFVPRRNVTIVNGTVRAFPGRGINAQHCSAVRVERVKAIANADIGIKAGNGISGPAGGLILLCEARENGSHGIHAESASIVSCTALSNGGRGITALASSVSACVASLNASDGIGGSGSLEACTAVANLGDGINWSGTVLSSRASNNAGQGIEVAAGSVVDSCRASFNDLDGFLLDEGSSIRRSVARDNGDDGIELRADSTAADNSCIANGRTSPTAAGIAAVNQGNRIDSNHVAGNPHGIRAYSSLNLVVRNSARASAIADFTLAPGNTFGEIFSGSGVVGAISPWANFSLDSSD